MNRFSGVTLASLLAAASMAPAGPALAQNQIIINNGTPCTWTSATIAPNGIFSFTVPGACGGAAPVPPVCSTPTIMPSSTIQAGSAATLTANCANSPTSYTWLAGAGSPLTASTTITAGPLVFPNAGTFSYQVTASNAAGSSTTMAFVTVTAAPSPTTVPACSASAIPSTLPSSGGTTTLTANCTNVSAGSTYAWTAQSGASAVVGSGSVVTANFAPGTAAASYTYQVTASNAMGAGAPASATVTVSPPAAAGCVIKDKAVLFPDWRAGNAYNTANSPQNHQPRNETWAFKFAKSELINVVNPNATSGVQLYETRDPMISVSISATPCEFSDTPTALLCQRSGNSGSLGLNFVVNGHSASDTTVTNAGYCRAPAFAGNDVYVNVKFAGAPNFVNPPSSTCTLLSCSYFMLYFKTQ